MAFFPDLSPYTYSRHPEDAALFNVGWLDAERPFTSGAVDGKILERLKNLASKPVNLCRGFHTCNLCPPTTLPKQTLPLNHGVLDMDNDYGRWLKARRGNGEIRISDGERTFAAPVLIVHYIEEHDYLPPQQFLDVLNKLL